MRRYPQVMRNVTVPDRAAAMADPGVAAAVEAAEKELGDGGRVLLRPSGTEPLVRVMVEAASETDAARHAEAIAAAVRRTAAARGLPPRGRPSPSRARCRRDRAAGRT